MNVRGWWRACIAGAEEFRREEDREDGGEGRGPEKDDGSEVSGAWMFSYTASILVGEAPDVYVLDPSARVHSRIVRILEYIVVSVFFGISPCSSAVKEDAVDEDGPSLGKGTGGGVNGRYFPLKISSRFPNPEEEEEA